VSADAGQNSAQISWDAADGNGTTVSAYVVREATGPDKGDSIATDGDATQATLTGLAGGAAATFSVVAESTCGAGPAATSAAVTPTGSTSTYVGAVQAQKPVAFYRLAEPTGTVMADSSGHAADGEYSTQETLGEPAALASDPATSTGYSMCCSGIGSATPKLPTFSDPRTVEAWIETSVSLANQAIASWGNSSTDEGFTVSVSTQSVNVDGYNDYLTFPTPRPVADGNWHLVTVTYDGSTVTVYLDGQLVGSSPFTGTLNTAAGSGLLVGVADLGGYNTLDGDLADLAVYSKALSASQVEAHFAASGYSRPTAPTDVRASYGGPNGVTVSWGGSTALGVSVTGYLVSAVGAPAGAPSVAVDGDATAAQLGGLETAAQHFKVQAFNQFGLGTAATSQSYTPSGSSSTFAGTVLSDSPSVFYRLADGTTAVMADSSGNDANGYYQAANAQLGQTGPVTSDPATAIIDQGLQDGMAFAPASGLPLYNQPRTVEAWFKTTSTATGLRALVSWGQSNTADAFTLAETPTSIVVQGTNDDRTFATPYPIDDGQWHQLVVTYDGSTATAYLDGVAIGSGGFPTTLDTLPGSPLVIGGYVSGGEGLYETDLADVAVYPSALSAARVAAHFAAAGYSRPGVVGSPSATAGANQATVNWSAPTSGNPTATGYLITALKAGTTAANSIAVAASQTSATITGLLGGTSYTFEVQAFNGYGEGPGTDTSAITPTGSSSTFAGTVLSDSPSVFYRLADGTTAVMADSSGNDANGYYQAANAQLGQTGPVTSDPATAATGSGAAIGDASAALPAYSQARSVVGWIKTTAAGTQYLVGWGSQATAEGFDVAVDASDVYVQGYSDDLTFPTGTSLDDGNWHFIAVSSNGKTATAYVDGTSLGTQKFSSPLDTVPSNGDLCVVGAAIWGGNGVYGDLADVAVFPTALTAGKLGALYSASAAPMRTLAKIGPDIARGGAP
jgi:hypothetical protein